MKDDIDLDSDEFSEEDLDAQDARVAAITGELHPRVSDEILSKYQDYLGGNLIKPCRLTGIEDFAWEEVYILGIGDDQEYNELKKIRPSYTDEFDFIGFEDPFDVNEGLFVRVRRVSDKKLFPLPLAELEAIDESSGNYQLLRDYTVWFVNSR